MEYRTKMDNLSTLLLWAFEQDEETGIVTVVPMNDKNIVIHGKKEAEMFCDILSQHFQ